MKINYSMKAVLIDWYDDVIIPFYEYFINYYRYRSFKNEDELYSKIIKKYNSYVEIPEYRSYTSNHHLEREFPSGDHSLDTYLFYKIKYYSKYSRDMKSKNVNINDKEKIEKLFNSFQIINDDYQNSLRDRLWIYKSAYHLLENLFNEYYEKEYTDKEVMEGYRRYDENKYKNVDIGKFQEEQYIISGKLLFETFDFDKQNFLKSLITTPSKKHFFSRLRSVANYFQPHKSTKINSNFTRVGLGGRKRFTKKKHYGKTRYRKY